MKSALLTTIVLLACSSLFADEDARNRKAVRPIPVDDSTADKVVEAIIAFRKVFEAADYGDCYADCVHQITKDRTSQDEFISQISPLGPTLIQFFTDIVDTYNKEGHTGANFQIRHMHSPHLEDVVVIEFVARKSKEPRERWPKGQPVRIQLAADKGDLKFYDID